MIACIEVTKNNGGQIRNKIHQNANHEAHQAWEVPIMCIDDGNII